MHIVYLLSKLLTFNESFETKVLAFIVFAFMRLHCGVKSHDNELQGASNG